MEHLIPDALFSGPEVPGKVDNQIGLAVKRHHCNPIALAHLPQRRVCSLGHSRDRRAHALTCIEEQNHIQGFFLVAKVRDLLPFPVIGHYEAFFLKTVYKPNPLTDLRIHMHERNIAAEGRLILSEQQKEKISHASARTRTPRANCELPA